jgi:hypothetical protein
VQASPHCEGKEEAVVSKLIRRPAACFALLGIVSVLALAALMPQAPVIAQGADGDGLKGAYYDNQDFTGTSIVRVDPVVNFDWGSGAPAGSREHGIR